MLKNMNQGTIWGVVVVVILVAAGLFVWRWAGQNAEPVPLTTIQPTSTVALPTANFFLPTTSPSALPSVTAAATSSTISVTDTGFSPVTITVPAGTTVTFVNNGQGLHWPASDVHPTHQLLPGFDALRGLATGETYSYTFSKAGSWTCHDHLNPTFKCTVVVQ